MPALPRPARFLRWGQLPLSYYINLIIDRLRAGAFTAGSVLFADANGNMQQNNANLFWDDTNNRLGVGTAAPGSSFEIAGGVRARGGSPGALGASNNGYAFQGIGDNDSGLYSLGDGQVSVYINNSERIRVVDSGVALGSSGPATSARLDIQGTDGAILLPRLTTAQRDALTAADGMLVYNTTTATVQARAGGAWVNL